MPSLVRPYRRSDRDQLTTLVNLHVATVLPGVELSTNVVLGQLEREPDERITDPWVAQRHCFVVEENEAVVGAALVHRYADDDRVPSDQQTMADIRWLVFQPSSTEAGRLLLDAVVAEARTWQTTRIGIDGTLPAPGCYGIPDSWPHVRRLLVEAGFEGPERTELVLAASCEQLRGHRLDGTKAARSVGDLGTRIDIQPAGDSREAESGSLGWIEVCSPGSALGRSAKAASWADVGNLFWAQDESAETIMPALFTAAAEWLLLGGVDRIIDYYAPDVHPPEYLAVLHRLGFSHLATNERVWTLG